MTKGFDEQELSIADAGLEVPVIPIIEEEEPAPKKKGGKKKTEPKVEGPGEAGDPEPKNEPDLGAALQ